MPTKLKRHRRGGKERWLYKRKGAVHGVTVRGKRHQIWSKKLDEARESKKRLPGSGMHTGDLHPRAFRRSV